MPQELPLMSWGGACAPEQAPEEQKKTRQRAKLDRLQEAAGWCKRAGKFDKELTRPPERHELTGWGVLRRLNAEELHLLRPHDPEWRVNACHAQQRYLQAHQGATSALADALAAHQRHLARPCPPIRAPSDTP